MKSNKLKDIIRNKNVRLGSIFIVGLLLGWLIFGGASGNKQTNGEE